MAKENKRSVTDHCDSIAYTIRNYRKGEIAKPSRDHVRTWLSQFPNRNKKSIARGMDSLLNEAFVTKKETRKLLANLIETKKLTGSNPKGYWKKVNFLRLQNEGSSQSELLQVFEKELYEKTELTIAECGRDGGPFFYLDDALYTGSTIRRDLLKWGATNLTKKTNVIVLTFLMFQYGEYYSRKVLEKELMESNSKIEFWRFEDIEDRKSKGKTCDVLRPRKMFRHQDIRDYANSLTYEPALRHNKNSSTLYLKERDRRSMEFEFLKAGLRIRSACAAPQDSLRPLGFSSLDSFGCGSPIVFYRNCPNTTPLCWWWGDPNAPSGTPLSEWYPLLPRKIS